MSVSVEIITIGTELLLGHLLDTNSVFIAQELAARGVDVYAKHSVGDNTRRLGAMLSEALERCDGVMTTGGLGPTVDDLTKDAVAQALSTTLELHAPSLDAIEERFALMGRTMSENNRRQAILPRDATVLDNPHGTAPGFVALRSDGKFIACMPGVPREMKPMLTERLLPWLCERYALHGGIFTRTLHTTGLGESEVDRRIEALFRTLENPKIAVLAHRASVAVKIMAKAENSREADALIAPVERELRERIGPHVFGSDDQTLEGAVIEALHVHKLRVAIAESITGGGICDALVRIPGASEALRGGVVAYSNDVKTTLLDVSEDDIRRYGAVSEPVASAMARGVRARLGADIGLATTGIAGPSGGSAEKPVGLVWFALAHNDRVETLRAVFPGERMDIRGRAIVSGLNLLWRTVVNSST